MSDVIDGSIKLIQGKIQELERELSDKKRVVNDLCSIDGRPPIYADLTMSSTIASIRSDEFYGKALATVVRLILEKRAAANMGAATVSEIYEAMMQGGYQFDAKNDENAKRGLYISLAKNTTVFHKLPNGTYGLVHWYPAMKPRAAREAQEPSGTPMGGPIGGDAGARGRLGGMSEADRAAVVAAKAVEAARVAFASNQLAEELHPKLPRPR